MFGNHREIILEQDATIRSLKFNLEHLETKKLKEKQEIIAELKEQNAVLQKENAMLDRIVDLNGDIVDIKELINTLIGKLPTIDLKSLTVHNGPSQ